MCEAKALDSLVRTCERHKNQVERRCGEVDLSDIGTSCLDLRKKTSICRLIQDFR